MKKVDRADLATRRSKRVHGFVSIDHRVNIRAVYNIACSDLTVKCLALDVVNLNRKNIFRTGKLIMRLEECFQTVKQITWYYLKLSKRQNWPGRIVQTVLVVSPRLAFLPHLIL